MTLNSWKNNRISNKYKILKTYSTPHHLDIHLHKYNNKVIQSGRSMVEVLGVLTIIGVLSVCAIGGYGYGMDKYRANQTINDVMLRSIDVITYTLQENELKSKWPSISTVGYPITFVEDSNGNYGIQVERIPTRVCKMVGDSLDTLAEVQIVTSDGYKDDPCDASEENTMIFFFTSFSSCPKCAEDEFCRWGECVTKTIEKNPKIGGTCTNDSDCQVDYTGTNCGSCLNGYCVSNRSVGGNSCVLSDGTVGQCVRGKCVPKGCNNENPCNGQYEYCASTNTSCTEAIPTDQMGACVKPDFKPIIVNNTEYWVSNTSITYWDAYAGCQVMGKEMVDVEDLALNWKGGKEWLDYTPLSKEIDKYYLTGSLWTKSPSNNSCYAWSVYLDGNGVYTNLDARNQRRVLFAVCK